MGRLTGGSGMMGAVLREAGLEEWVRVFDEWLGNLPRRSWESALKVSEEFQDFCEKYIQAMQKVSSLGVRGLRCEFLSLCARWFGSALRRGEAVFLPYLSGVLEMHRVVQQNAHFGYMSDAYFCGVLRRSWDDLQGYRDFGV